MAGPTVTVGSKLPHGLILQLQEPIAVGQKTEIDAAGKPVLRDITIQQFVGDRYVLKGVAPIQARLPNADGRLIEGAVLTHGIPADFWAKWKEQNKGADYLTKGVIFAHEKDAAGAAREVRAEKSGFEPTDPSNLPQEFRRNIETARA